VDVELSNAVRARQRGMSIVEVLIALTILAMALLSLMPLFTGAVKIAASSYQLANANTRVRERLEELTGYPRSDSRLTIPDGANAAVPAGVTTTGSGSVVAVNPACNNDLPSWYEASTGKVSSASTSPGPGWYVYPYVRTYTVEQFDGTLANRVTAPSAYIAKLVTVTVRPTRGPFPGLRQTTQSLYLRFPNG